MRIIKNFRYKLNLRKLLLKRMYLLLLIPLLFIAYPLSSPGIPIAVDFPSLDTVDPSGRLWAWLEKGSFPGLEIIPRFPLIGLWYILGFLGINPALISKFMIMIGFFIASFSFYFCFLLLFKHSNTTKDSGSDANLNIAAVIGAIFFAYNPWSFERITHWYLWIGYTVLPLFFVSIVYAFRNPRSWKYIASSIFLWSFASTTPHMIVFYGMIFVVTFASFVLNNLFAKIRNTKDLINNRIKSQTDNKKNSTILVLLIPFLTIIFLYVLVNAYWIYPYVMSSQIRTVSPNYLLVQENLETLSRNSNFLNVFRLVGYWTQPFDFPVEGTIFYYLWFLAGLGVSIFGFSALIISRDFMKYTAIFSLFALVGLILAMGTQSPINYFNYLLENPKLTNFGWLLRDPDKWEFLVAFTYSFLISIASYKLLGRLLGRRVRILEPGEADWQMTKKARELNKRGLLVGVFFLCLLIGSISLHSYPRYVFSMLAEVRPVPLPAEFDELNSYLSDVKTGNVYFLPYPHIETTWNKQNPVGNVYQTFSLRPSIESSGTSGMAGMEGRNYYNYITKSIIENRTKDISNFIYPLGTSYLIFHNDTWDKKNNSPVIEDIEFLGEINSLEGMERENNIGFYNIFKIRGDNNYTAIDREPQQVSILNNNIAVLGGLEVLQSLNSLLPFFSSLYSSVYFVDDTKRAVTAEDSLDRSDVLILGKGSSYYDLLFSLVENKYLLEPSKETTTYDPFRAWSKAGALDPQYGFFHQPLEKLGISNWQFDYGKGLVITQASGANLSIPVDIAEAGKYDIFLRFLKNQKGGVLKIYLDNKFIQQVNTLDDRSNVFLWENILDNSAPLYLSKGKHTITLENVAGFNAVNIFSVIPSGQISELRDKVSSIANKTGNIYLLEAESSFYTNKGRSIDRETGALSQPSSLYYVFDADNAHIGNASSFNENNQNFNNSRSNNTLTGQLNVPENAEFVSLLLLTKEQSNHYNYSNISNKIFPGPKYVLRVSPDIERRNIFESDFETSKILITLADLRRSQWKNDDDGALSKSIETDNPISGDASLRIDVRQGNKSEWNSIHTNFITIKDQSYYNFHVDVSASSVKQFHPKVIYYDENRKKIEDDVISVGRDGTFQDKYLASIVPPLGTKYLRFEMFTMPIASGRTSYLIDNVRLEEISTPARSFYFLPTNNALPHYDNKSESYPNANYDNKSESYPNTNYDNKSESYPNATLMIQKTRPIPVTENSVYNFSVSLEGRENVTTLGKSSKLGSENIKKNPVPVGVIAHFTNASDVIENTTKYGRNASGGSVLTLDPDSEIYTDLDILKPANYTIALKANTCEDCSSFLTVTIHDKDNNSIIRTGTVSLKKDSNNINNRIAVENKTSTANKDYDSNRNDGRELDWLYLNGSTYLDKGAYDIKINSNSTSKLDLDSVVVYTSYDDKKYDSPSISGTDIKEHETLDEIFSSQTEHSPAYLADYKKIDPTKYEVNIKNATRPYILSLAETYDPLWMASYDINSNSPSDTEFKNHNDNGNNFKIPSIPLYSVVNGFYVNKTGDYTLTIEYQPQKWFIQGALISIITAISILIFLIVSTKFHTLTKRIRLIKFRDKAIGENKR